MRADPEDAPPGLTEARSPLRIRQAGATLLWLFVLAVMALAAGVIGLHFWPYWRDPLALSMFAVPILIGVASLWRIGVAWQPARAALSDPVEGRLVFARSLTGNAIACLALAAITAAVLLSAAAEPGRTLAWIFGAVFALLTLISLGMAIERRPLVIDRDGISGAGWRGRPVPWTAIDKVITYSIRGTPGIKIYLKAPGTYPVPPRFASTDLQSLRLVSIMPTTYATDTETLMEAFAQFQTPAEQLTRS